MRVLVTDAAGFIGSHVARRLAERKKCDVLGVNHRNNDHDVALKGARLAGLGPFDLLETSADLTRVQAEFGCRR